MKQIAIYLSSIFLFISLAISTSWCKDFSGTYTIIKTPGNAWCGKSISLKKIRFQWYKVTWKMRNGKETVALLKGVIKGNMIDFRRDNHGYVYTFTDNNRRLEVKLTLPGEVRKCQFLRAGK